MFKSNIPLALPAFLRALFPRLLPEKTMVNILAYRTFDRLEEAFRACNFVKCNLYTEADWEGMSSTQKDHLLETQVLFVGLDYEYDILETFVNNTSQQKLTVLLPSKILFSEKKQDIELRKKLLDKNVVQLSCQLPNDIFPHRSLQYSILLLDNTRDEAGEKNVSFIDAHSIDVNTLHDLAVNGDVDGISYFLQTFFLYQMQQNSYKVEELYEKDANLLALTRCLTPKERIAQQMLKTQKTIKLGKLVTLLRSPMPQKDGTGEHYPMLKTDSFATYGYTIPESDDDLILTMDGKEDRFLRPNDIVLTCKGTIGKLALIKNDWDDFLPWVVNHSCVILRADKGIDPRLIFLYLRSDIGQILLLRQSSKSNFTVLQNNKIKDIDVLIPAPAEVDKILQRFDEECVMTQKIDALKAELDELASKNWEIVDED